MADDTAVYEFTVKLDAQTVARGMQRVMSRGKRPSLWMLIGMGAFFGVMFALEPPAWQIGLMAFSLALIVFLLLLFGLQRAMVMRLARDYVELLENAELHHRVSCEVLWLGHPLVSSTIRWEAVRYIHKMKDMWALELRGNRAVTSLPLDQVPWETLCFIESQVVAHGGESDEDPRR